MDYAQAIGEMLRLLRRRASVLILVAIVGTVASVVFALKQPPQYETTAKILIESQQISTDLARSTVNLTAAERLQLIEQRLMARDNLLAVIDKLGLFAGAGDMRPAEKVDLLRKAIQIQSIAVSGQSWGNDTGVFAFTITARLGDAEQAVAVVNEFVESAIDQNVRVRAARAGETLAYFDLEETRAGDAVAALEAEIAAFKRTHEDALPESLSFRRDELTRLRENDQEIDQRIFDLQEQRGTLTLALAGERSLNGLDTVAPDPEEVELRQLELELASRRSVLAATHPEIRRLRERIAAVVDLIDTESDEAASPEGDNSPRSDAIRRQISEFSAQVEVLRQRKGEIEKRRTALEESIRQTPQVEIALNALTRRLGELQEQHSVLLRARAEAQTGEQLEANQQSERFQVVENALVPDYPVGPNRKKIAVLGSGASVGLALGLVVLLEMLHPVLRNSAQMERQLNLRPVVAIPYVKTAWERRRRRVWIAGVALIIAGLVAAVPLADSQGLRLDKLVIEGFRDITGIASQG